MRRTPLILIALAVALSGCSAPSTSKWQGYWKPADADDIGGDLHCVARRLDDTAWKAEFSGYCGKYFVYEIQMYGQQEYDKVAFEGDVDLGVKDGGVYHWTGQMTSDSFVGEYSSSAGKKGTFRMTPK